MNNVLIYITKIKNINKIKKVLKAKFYMSDLRLIYYYQKMAMIRNCANQIFCFCQPAYLEKINIIR